jgi:scyllo-inositol 2-dehydrogenase (NADP+)
MVRLPNDGSHTASLVLRTSLVATWAHWAQSGPQHLAGSLRYGNDEVFRRFAAAVRSSAQPVGIGAADALAVLRMQHEILERVERLQAPHESAA